MEGEIRREKTGDRIEKSQKKDKIRFQRKQLEKKNKLIKRKETKQNANQASTV